MFNSSALPVFLQVLLGLSIPLSTIILLARLLSSFCNVQIQPWLLGAAALLSFPLTFAARGYWVRVRHRRAARAAGAILPPDCHGKYPGNIDLIRQMLKAFDELYPAEFHARVTEKLGVVFNVRLLWENNYFTSEPEHIKSMLATDFSAFEKGSELQQLMFSVLGVGVFNSDGDMWKFHRSMTRPFFSRERISHFTLFDRHADFALNKMKSRFSEGYAVDFQDAIARFTLDSATEFLFGHCIHSLSNNLPYPHDVVAPSRDVASGIADQFSHAFAKAQHVIVKRSIIGDYWPLLELFKDKSEDSMKVINEFLEPIMRNAVEKATAKSSSEHPCEDEEEETLLSHLVKFTDDQAVLHDEILNILLAGRDTTAGTLTFAVYALAMYPHIFARLRNEILSQVGPTRRPISNDINQMKYLRAFLNETLRVFPVVPFNRRTATTDTTWASNSPDEKPIFIPKGTTCVYSILVMHHRKDLWGPDADQFDPDRFLDERLKKYLVPRPYIFLPFNAGPRICLGQQFAYNEMSFFLVRLLQNFDSITLALDAQPPESRVPESWKKDHGRARVEKVIPKANLTLSSFGGMWVRMSEAKD